MSIGTITEAKIKEIFKDEFERYFRETHGTFVIEGGNPTERHEPCEYALTTQSAQGISFFEGGIAKCRAGKNFEIYSGDSLRSVELNRFAIVLDAETGSVKIIAKTGDVVADSDYIRNYSAGSYKLFLSPESFGFF